MWLVINMTANTDLAPRILARIQKGKSRTMQPRMKVFAMAVLILLVLVIGLVSVPSVRAAIQRWIGYVPGIGLVSEGQIRVLAEPVSSHAGWHYADSGRGMGRLRTAPSSKFRSRAGHGESWLTTLRRMAASTTRFCACPMAN